MRGVKIALCVLAFFAALCLTLYPLASNYLADKYQSTAMSDYVAAVSDMDDTYRTTAWQQAQDYNRRIADRAVPMDGPDAALYLNTPESGYGKNATGQQPASPEFPDTIREVLYQTDPMQYQPVWEDGWEDYIPSERYVRLALRLLEGERVFADPAIVFQALFPQGSGIACTYHDYDLNNDTYFCWTNYPDKDPHSVFRAFCPSLSIGTEQGF